MRPVFLSHIFCEDAALIQPKINGTLQPFFEGQFSWVWYAGIIQHNRIKLVASLKTSHLAKEGPSSLGCQVEALGELPGHK